MQPCYRVGYTSIVDAVEIVGKGITMREPTMLDLFDNDSPLAKSVDRALAKGRSTRCDRCGDMWGRHNFLGMCKREAEESAENIRAMKKSADSSSSA